MLADWLRSDRARSLVLLPVLAALIVGALAVVAVALRPTSYQSRALVLVDQPGVLAASSDGAVIDKLVRLRAKYAGLVITDRIAAPVAEEVDRPLDEIRGQLTALPVEGTTLIAVSGRAEQADEAQSLTQAAADTLVTDAAADQAQFAVPEQGRVVLSVVTPAEEPVELGASTRRLTGIAVVSGGLAAALVSAVMLALGRRG